MALPRRLQETFTPAEMAFIAENTLVDIMPRQDGEEIQLIGGKVPKITALSRTKVPLWLALLLKKQKRCKIVVPEWLTYDALKHAYQQESIHLDRFSNCVPYEWSELSVAILESAADDLDSSPDKIRALLRDLAEIRQSKVRNGVRHINPEYLQMDNMGATELNELRPFVASAMDQLRRLSNLKEEEEEEEEQDDQDAPILFT